jgi:hypothetical protein
MSCSDANHHSQYAKTPKQVQGRGSRQGDKIKHSYTNPDKERITAELVDEPSFTSENQEAASPAAGARPVVRAEGSLSQDRYVWSPSFLWNVRILDLAMWTATSPWFDDMCGSEQCT